MGDHCSERRIEIDAPPEVVWDFIADFEGWAEWNPLYVKTTGRAEPGERIHFAVKLEGLKPSKGSATVTAAKAPELLEYTMSNAGGLLKVRRYIAVEEISPTRCAVVNGESMSGPLAALVCRAVGHKVTKGLEGMNKVLRQIAELKWMGRPDEF
ncbi:SRPBCC domain-containing protein [Novosphingobium album (ex Hu et al. 2023)]|uniref:SRPBCC domain-containing protein n=1 Tax=Novosphingobium album (ex Hu et al. 2023) TaxID=2930093 RepID=A0ABT0B3W4_9SPHN|nr:SRPBCC domain-containing protein [Novosphingobium album (ex Hu et al. 2023)]MCJ2179736.1 SRPBCC domain-containing protein [Novosphingobium album (ex Hu et al. 2023)]